MQSFGKAVSCLAYHIALLPALLGPQRGGRYKPPARREGPEATFSDELGRGGIGRKGKTTKYVIGERNIGRVKGL